MFFFFFHGQEKSHFRLNAKMNNYENSIMQECITVTYSKLQRTVYIVKNNYRLVLCYGKYRNLIG